jgi:hypothetical protein
MPKKSYLNCIPKLVHECTNKYLQHLYYHWVHQSVGLQFSLHFRSSTSHRSSFFPSKRTLKYIPTAYTSTTYVTLDWKDFVAWYELFVSCEEVEIYMYLITI